MKKSILFLIIGAITISSFILFSCSKEDNTKSKTDKVTSQSISANDVAGILKIYHQNENNKEAGPIWDKIKKWIKAHIGTHLFNNCTGSNPCGPCPGICIPISKSSVVVPDNYKLTNGEIEDGERLFVLTMLDETTFLVSFIDTQDFVYKDNFVFSEDLDLGPDVAKAFGKETFIVKKADYPVVYDYDPKGETVISILK